MSSDEARPDTTVVPVPLYSVLSRVVHSHALCELAAQSLRVTTPEAQWAYAVELPPQPSVGTLPSALAANLRILVHDGEIGLGLLTADGEYQNEVRVGAGEAERVDIALPPGTTLGSLVVRNTSASGRSRADIEIISCETAPDAEQPYWAALRAVAGDALCIRAGDMLHVRTPQARWASAVVLPPQRGAKVLAAGFAVNLKVQVHDGEIGLGLLTTGGEYRHEVVVGASGEAERVDLALPPGTTLGSLMVRNTSASGRSRADIELVGCEAAPGAEQPYWTALRTVSDDAICKRVGDMLRVTTPKALWASAVEFPPQLGAKALRAGRALNLRVLVHDGEIGLGLLSADGEYQNEVRVGARGEAERVDIVLPSDALLGSLLVRNTSAAGRSWADIEITGYEVAPGAEEPYWTALRAVSGDALCVRVGDMLHVTTPQARWASAVAFPPQPGAKALPVGCALNLRVLVHVGEVGLGLLTADGECQNELLVGAGGEAERVDIVLPASTPLGSLSVRNTSAAGKSRADIEITGYETAPGAEQPYWTALRTVSDDAVCKRAGDMLQVTTPKAQWASAVEFPVQEGSGVLLAALALNLRVLVHDGEIGLGLLTANGEYQSEMRVGASEEAERVDMVLPVSTPLGSLSVRNTSAAGRSRADIEITGYEVAPGVEQPYWTALRTVSNAAVCKRVGDVLQVTTPEAQWTSAVEFPLQDGAAVLPAALALNLRVLVHDGEIGLGVLTPDGEYRHEVRIGAGGEAECADIVLPRGTALGSLVVRNTSASGRSRADIELIGCEPAPGAEQPYWTALRTVSYDAICTRGGAMLSVTTPEAQWADAVEFPPQQNMAVFQSPVTLKLSARVHEGDVAVRVLTPTRACYCEARVEANTDAELVEIPLPSGSQLGSLIIRNQSRAGRSKLDLEILGCVQNSVGDSSVSKFRRLFRGTEIEVRTIPVLTSIPRSGTHYLKYLISEALGIPPLEKDLTADPDELRAALLAQPGTHLIYGHFRYPLHGTILDDKANPDMRLVLLTRHPLDRLISQLAYAQTLGGPVPLDLSPQQIARELMLGHWDGEWWPDGRMYEDCVAHQIAVLRGLVTDWLENRNCHLVRFEDLISQPVDVLTGCLAFLGVSLPREEVEKITERINFASLSGGRSRGQADPKSHYRKGVAGEWREVFSSADLDIIRRKCGDEYRKAGYAL